MALIGRRGLLRGLVALVAAPAIVRASSLMPISVPELVPVVPVVPGPMMATVSGIDAFGNYVTETFPLLGNSMNRTAFRSISSIAFAEPPAALARSWKISAAF